MFLMYGVEQQNREEDIEAAKLALTDVGVGDQIHIGFRRRIDQRAVSMAMLRAAYLATFAIFGYAYVCQTSLNPIRLALTADDGSLVLPVLFNAEGKRGDRAIVKVAEPEWLTDAVAVLIDQAVVVLPPLLGGNRDPVAELATRRGDPTEPSGNLRVAHPYGWPTQPGHAFDAWVLEHRNT